MAEDALAWAGFHDITVETVPFLPRLPTAADCVRFERESFGAPHQMLSGLTEPEREEAWAEIATELARFDGPDGFVGPSKCSSSRVPGDRCGYLDLVRRWRG